MENRFPNNYRNFRRNVRGYRGNRGRGSYSNNYYYEDEHQNVNFSQPRYNSARRSRFNTNYSRNNYSNRSNNEHIRNVENELENVQIQSADETSLLHDTGINNKKVNKILKSDGDHNHRDKLLKQISEGTYECMICVLNIKKESAVWHCDNCYHIYHIHCVKKWAASCTSPTNKLWRCPACQSSYDLNDKIIYECFCHKFKEPEYDFKITPHSCGEICNKKSRTLKDCPHLCTLLCHPGPCPTCEASIVSPCFCNKTSMTVKCTIAATDLSCGKICDKELNCKIHKCDKICHPGECDNCNIDIEQNCFCGKLKSKNIKCGSENVLISCGDVCNKIIECGEHTCDLKCHNGPCSVCQLTPEKLKYCSCGKTSIESLSIVRTSCIDPIPTCQLICNKPRKYCAHNCSAKCHLGLCPPCKLRTNARCRCKRTSLNLQCFQIAESFEMDGGIKCSNKCNARKSCGVHRCNELCCPARSETHYCSQICGKLLSCRQHRCQQLCHQGNCPKCTSLSFDELFCACGTAVALPPIECGQEPPVCMELCSRAQNCPFNHPVQHNCHPDNIECVPCVVLTDKMCPGEHTMLHNIPCSHPVSTCGVKCAKQLETCHHTCINLCHAGDCPSNCNQACGKIREDCGHPCQSPCHATEPNKLCHEIKSCSYPVLVYCQCMNRQTQIICQKFVQIKVILRSDPIGSEFQIMPGSDQIIMICNDECKKVARSKQLADAFLIDAKSSKFVRTNDNGTLYSQHMRDFATDNPDILQKFDKIMVDLITKLRNGNSKTATYNIQGPLSRSKRDFIKEMADQFCLKMETLVKEPNKPIVIEAAKGYCKIPNVRLLTFMQKNYPHLFSNRQKTLRHAPLSMIDIGTSSFGEEMTSLKDIKNSEENLDHSD